MKQENEKKNENEKDDIDKYIEDIVNKKISEPEGFEKAIREALYSDKFNKKLRKRQIIRTISTACATVILTSGVAIGGFIVYEKVWKEPKQYTYEELKNTIADTEVSDEEKKDLISEEQAKQTALEIAKNLGYENEVVESIELKQNKEEGYESTYYLINANNNIEKLNMRVDAKTGELVSLENKDILRNQNKLEKITEQEAEEISSKIFKIISDELYEFNECKQENVIYKGKQATVWISNYYKKYNEIINPYEQLSIQFFKNDNKIEVSSISKNNNGKYENNEEIISEKEALDIAINKEKELTANEITGYAVEKGIRKANKYIYELEKYSIKKNNENQKNENQFTETENIARNVWIVKITHNNQITDKLENYIKGINKEYYIDITTGEIIGGKESKIE